MTLRNGTSSNFAAGASVTVRLSDEASKLLQGESIPYQDCTDLAIWPDVVRRRLAQTGYSKMAVAEAPTAGSSKSDKAPVPDFIIDDWLKVSPKLPFIVKANVLVVG
jgi:hypothetical protein